MEFHTTVLLSLKSYIEHTYKLSQNFEQQQEGSLQNPQKLSPKEDDLELNLSTGLKLMIVIENDIIFITV